MKAWRNITNDDKPGTVAPKGMPSPPLVSAFAKAFDPTAGDTPDNRAAIDVLCKHLAAMAAEDEDIIPKMLENIIAEDAYRMEHPIASQPAPPPARIVVPVEVLAEVALDF